ncbi:MAG TPA: gluconate 2-dehydrogenase subunit 3 family protein [Solirubrobacterales bacterium]|nr:gluconate 2-dehydrogenase subunit 3 family protein [Solirubrobacterales bacterium]
MSLDGRRCGGFLGVYPSNSPQRTPGPPANLPRQRRGTTPQMRGRYPDYDVLAEAGHWDEATRRVVLDRVERIPPIHFFDEREAATLGAFCDVVLAQDAPPRIPVLAMVDEKLSEGRGEGYRHADMPPDGQTWREVARMLDAAAAAGDSAGARAESFAALELDAQQRIVGRFAGGELEWRIPVAKAWSVVMRDALSAFYSHPWAWSEIGFGGPAYPRGYARLGPGQREHWESPPEFELDPVRDVGERGIE